MTNVAEPWLRANGYGTAEPDRVEAIAQSLAAMPGRGERASRAQRLKSLHGQAIAQRIVDRARDILRDRREEHA